MQSFRTVYGMVSSYIKDPYIRQVLSFHPLLIGGNPFTVTSIYVLISFLERKWGVHSAMGGTGAVVKGLVSLVEGQGSEIRYKSEVEQILVKDGKAVGVRLDDRRGDPGQRGHLQCRCGDDLSASCCTGMSAQRWTDQEARRAPISPTGSSSGTSAPSASIRT